MRREEPANVRRCRIYLNVCLALATATAISGVLWVIVSALTPPAGVDLVAGGYALHQLGITAIIAGARFLLTYHADGDDTPTAPAPDETGSPRH